VSTLNEWISKLVRDLVLSRKCNNESKIERFGFIHINEFYTYVSLSLVLDQMFPSIWF